MWFVQERLAGCAEWISIEFPFRAGRGKERLLWLPVLRWLFLELFLLYAFAGINRQKGMTLVMGWICRQLLAASSQLSISRGCGFFRFKMNIDFAWYPSDNR